MREHPRLETERLLLRAFLDRDAAVVQQLAGHPQVADTTSNIPHPYEDGLAERFIATTRARFERGELVNFAVVQRQTGDLVGAIGLMLDAEQPRAELGYWVGVPWWGCGFATEAAIATVGYGFAHLGLARIFAHVFARNPASGRVLCKVGFTHEGTLRHHLRKGDRFEDIEVYGLLAGEWSPPTSAGGAP